jgi:hypothetical protein
LDFRNARLYLTQKAEIVRIQIAMSEVNNEREPTPMD